MQFPFWIAESSQVYASHFQNIVEMASEEIGLNKTEKKDVNNASEETEAESQMMNDCDESESDQIVSVIGNTGRWQLEKLLLVFLVSIPGVAHIFVSAFVAPKTDFWCEEESTTDLPVADVADILKVNTLVTETCFLLLLNYFRIIVR